MSGSGRRSKLAVEVNAAAFIERHGIDCVGFLTLTFPDHLKDAREALKRFNSLLTGVIRPRYREAMRILERTKAGDVHFHLLVALGQDIRMGFDFEAACPPKGSGRRPDYRSASLFLRREWGFWREAGPRYGFGRHELLPVRDTSAISRYLAKYISKHMGARKPEDKGLRLVGYTGPRVVSASFGWAHGRGRASRVGVQPLLDLLVRADQLPVGTEESAIKYFGESWRFRFRREIAGLGQDPPIFPERRFWSRLEAMWPQCGELIRSDGAVDIG